MNFKYCYNRPSDLIKLPNLIEVRYLLNVNRSCGDSQQAFYMLIVKTQRNIPVTCEQRLGDVVY